MSGKQVRIKKNSPVAKPKPHCDKAIVQKTEFKKLVKFLDLLRAWQEI